MNIALLKDSGMRLCFWRQSFILVLFLTGLTAADLFAAKPELSYLHPAGAQRGTTVSVEAAGKNASWPPKVLTDRAGITVEPEKDKGKLKITVDSDAVPGVYWVRLHNDEGASPLRPFVVGTLPEMNEKEPNNDYREPQLLETSTVIVNGRINGSSDVDTFAVKLAAGQTLVASMAANEVLGSPMDAILEVTSPNGFRLAFNHDTYNLDPQVVFTAQEAGTYLVRSFAFPSKPNQSISFSASASYVYRLTLTTAAFVDHAFPLAASQNHPTEIELRGWNIPQPVRFYTVPSSSSLQDVAPLFHPELGNTALIKTVPHAVTVESAVNDAQHPQPIKLPMTISGSISEERDEDWYQFTAKKGQRVEFRAESWALGFPLDPLIRLTDAAGKRLAQVDDINRSQRDAVLAHTIPADGDYRLMIRDLNRDGGFRYVYRLTGILPQADFNLKLAADAFTLTPGTALEIPVTVGRLHGYGGEISITAVDLPAGVTATTVVSKKKGDTAKSVKLQLTSDAGPVSGPIRIVGTVAGETPLSRTAEATITGFTATTAAPWLTVLKPAETK
ncbi:putative subtilase-type serine protease precursor [Symmachiella macrocystis]|uniref:Putative subtilase-type serine protease n=2 Tax=Symmachiella macrocystis TaxID=2527985 RepID=A0A5C6B6M7_9PLAN|nr:putative subtilase-type serine protease precursor [Symmachiella macrocystis]